MIETSEVSKIGATDIDLDGIAALLVQQITASHTAAKRCFAKSEELENTYNQYDALKIATRLMQASAVAANAIKRIRGSEFHQHVTVSNGAGS